MSSCWRLPVVRLLYVRDRTEGAQRAGMVVVGPTVVVVEMVVVIRGVGAVVVRVKVD